MTRHRKPDETHLEAMVVTYHKLWERRIVEAQRTVGALSLLEWFEAVGAEVDDLAKDFHRVTDGDAHAAEHALEGYGALAGTASWLGDDADRRAVAIACVTSVDAVHETAAVASGAMAKPGPDGLPYHVSLQHNAQSAWLLLTAMVGVRVTDDDEVIPADDGDDLDALRAAVTEDVAARGPSTSWDVLDIAQALAPWEAELEQLDEVLKQPVTAVSDVEAATLLRAADKRWTILDALAESVPVRTQNAQLRGFYEGYLAVMTHAAQRHALSLWIARSTDSVAHQASRYRIKAGVTRLDVESAELTTQAMNARTRQFEALAV
jgi:hypothetical protein